MTLTVTKVFDHDCPICSFMASFDGKVLFDLKPAVTMKAIELGRLIDPDNENAFECILAQYVERHAVNDDYTLDLPVYMVTQGKTYLGHTKGELSQSELRSKLEEIIADASDPKSESGAGEGWDVL